MSAAGPLDGPIELARLVPPPELDELLGSIRRALGTELAIYDPSGVRLAGPASAGAPHHDVMRDGELLARLAATGPNTAAALALATETLDLLIHHSYLAGQMKAALKEGKEMPPEVRQLIQTVKGHHHGMPHPVAPIP